MPRKFIDKKKATTFHLVHRSQRDPLINDPDSSSRVLKYVPAPNSKVLTREELEDELEVDNIRQNEGEAAEYGIYFDDTEYDYMQHLRSVGEAPDAVLLSAPSKGKGKAVPKEVVFGEKLGIPKEVLPSEEESKYRIETMQDIPDSLRGFQPDMDPDLREVLEALEEELEQAKDDSSDDQDPEDLFAELVKGGEQPQEEQHEEDYDSDDTIKGRFEQSEYLAEMAQYKTAPRALEDTDSVIGGIETESMFSRTSTANTHRTSKQRRRRRQKLGGAYSEAGTDFSMTSSANFRNAGLTNLDDRFDKILEEYNEGDGDDEASVISEAPSDVPSEAPSVTIAPKQFKETRADFDAIMDEFLGQYKVRGKKMVKNVSGAKSGGMAELDEIRRELGKARIS